VNANFIWSTGLMVAGRHFDRRAAGGDASKALFQSRDVQRDRLANVIGNWRPVVVDLDLRLHNVSVISAFMKTFVACEYLVNARNVADQRMARPIENVSLSRGPQIGLLEFRYGRGNLQNLEHFGIVEVDEDAT